MAKKRIMAILMSAAMVAGTLSGGAISAFAEDAAAGDKTITISVQNTEGAEAGWNAVAQAYMALHEDVEVVVDLKPQDGYDQWLNNVFATNDTTSVDIVNINLAAEAATNKSINYADYIENDSPYSDGVWKDQFEYGKQVIGAGTGKFDALSLDSVQVTWLYNQNIFDEVGVVPPTTWDELLDVCAKLEEAGYQPIAMAGDYNSFYSGAMGWLGQIYADQTTRSMIEVTRSQEGDYTYDPDIDSYFEYNPEDPFNDDSTYVTQNPVRFFKAVYEGTYTAQTPGMKTVWENFAKVFPTYAGKEVMFGTDKDGAKSLFYQGKAAMWVAGGWEIVGFNNAMKSLEAGEEITNSSGEAIEDVKGFTLGTFNMPSMEGEGIEAKARTIEVANGFLGCVSKAQEHDDLVVDFLMYYSSADGMTEFVNAALEDGYVPNGPSLVYGVQYPEEIENAFANLTMIGNCQKDYGQALARGFCEIPESYRAFYDYCYEYLNGSIDVDTFLEKHEQNIMDNFETGMTNTKITYEDLENPANEPTGN